MFFFNPQKQRAGVMQREPHTRMFFDESEKGVVGVFVAFFKYVQEIPARLMRVNDKDELKRRAGWRHLLHTI